MHYLAAGHWDKRHINIISTSQHWHCTIPILLLHPIWSMLLTMTHGSLWFTSVHSISSAFVNFLPNKHTCHTNFVWEMRRGVSRQNCEWRNSPPPFSCWAKCLFPGTDRNPRRQSEEFYHFYRGRSSSQKALETVGQSWRQQQHCLLPHFPFLVSRVRDRINRHNNSLDDFSS